MILTNEFLRRESIKRDISNASETRILNKNHTVFSKKESYDLFISLSFLDKKLILTLIDLFNNAGYSVYVDWIDDKNLDKNNVSYKTAKFIRNRISECKGLSYIATGNIVNSKWCPWELGLADGLLNGKACILPILKEPGVFNGVEFVGIYPIIEFDILKNDFCIKGQNDNCINYNLKKWLNERTV